jgi:hypothetical protein
MKKLITSFILLSTFFCSAQINYLSMPDDFCSNSGPSPSFLASGTTNSSNGWAHTPKGNLHILIIFISDASNVPPPWYGGDPYQAGNISHWSPTLIPNWAMGSSNHSR